MSALDDLRARLARARADHAARRTAYLGAREALARAEADLQRLARTFDPKNPKHVAERRALEARRAADARAVEAALGGKRAALGNIRDGLAGIADLGEPERVAGLLDDKHPILLYPLRIETRFKKVAAASNAAPADELWVRIYPDDCQVETFTEILTASELANVKSFWTAHWAAGGVEAEERAAWRSLVAAHGAGRAAWLVQQLVPATPADRPVKTDPTDLFLVVPADPALDVVQEGATRMFWTAWWKAGDDAEARSTAVAALRAATGSDALTRTIRQSIVPPNIGTPPPPGKSRDEIRVETVFIRFPPDDNTPIAGSSWLQAPAVRTMPERLVILGFRGGAQVMRAVTATVAEELHVGPDPSLPDAEQMKHAGGELEVNEELRWMVDFDAAIAKGMGRKIPITAQDAALGFDTLVVIGLRASTDPAAGAAELERLLTNHLQGTSGLGLVTQGTPTNNTEGAGAGYRSLDDADAAFDLVFMGKEAFEETGDEGAKADGQWLAEGLGISTVLWKQVPHAASRDQVEARAMNTALWPATWGYFLEEMMATAISPADVAATRAFFTRFVSGRGPLPALRIGRQPYGLLPATAFSRLAFAGRDGAYLNRLRTLLAELDRHWSGLVAGVSTVTKAGDPHQLLLDVVGLHPGSVEYYQRYAQSFAQMYNALLLRSGEPWGRIFAAAQERARAAVMSAAGVPAGTRPPIFDKYFLERASLLKGDVIDDQPLSETRPVRPFTADEKNYLHWLADSTLETIRLEDFGGPPPPRALLYLWLRHALLLAYWDGGLKLYERAGLATSRAEPAFIHVEAGPSATSGVAASESRWAPLYRTADAITGARDLLVADFLSKSDVVTTKPELAQLRAIKDAIGVLEDTPTARLERLFAEHVDCCHYRLDAWKNGLVAARLWEMRGADGGGAGLYTGAYGWLENVRSENKPLVEAPLSPAQATVFRQPGEAAPLRDDSNAGFIHAPSVAQASAAAVLRSAYLSAASPAAVDAYAVDLGSERVRRALALLEGIRNGQSLSALLGYQFERGLHDRHALAEVDQFIYPLRKAFPLVADRMKDTVTGAKTAIDEIEARNVVDGLKLVDHLKTAASKTYPFDLTDLPPADGAQTAAISAEVAGLLDSNDAVADLVLSESVYQVVQGNFDRAAANGDAISKGGYPPEIEVVKTPRTGRALTQRFAIHFDADVDPGTSPELGLAVTPRARAEAPVNHWLHGVLPRPSDIGCRVTVHSHADGSTTTVDVTAKALGLQPIDLLMAGGIDAEQAMTELDDRVWHHLRRVGAAHPLDDFTIEYMVPATGGGVSFFQAGALLRSLRAVLLKSPWLRPEQLALPQEAEEQDANGEIDTADLEARVEATRAPLVAHVATLTALGTNTADGIEVFVDEVAGELLASAFFGLPQTSPGALFSELSGIFRALTAKVRALLLRWDERIAAYDALGGQLAVAASDDERLELLARMETKVASALTSPRPASAAAYQAIVEGRRLGLDQLYGRFRGHLATPTADLDAFMPALLADVQAIPAFDSVPFDADRGANDLAPEAARINALRQLAQEKVRELADDITTRSDEVTALFEEAAAATEPSRQVEILLAAGKRVLGDEAPLLPRFTLPAAQGDELALAFADSEQLLAHQRDVLFNRFPADDWLYGLARVKDKMFHWENVVLLAGALGSTRNPDLTPAQLPYRPSDSWLALAYPAGYAFDSEKLLYTAHLARPFDKAARQTGILVEEWTEVIPNADEVTGLAFQYDQPDTEPPQVMLLLVPPQLTGAWKWDDVVAGIQETFDMARRRAVEPTQLDDGVHGQLLPATIMAVTLHQVTIATNLAVANGVYDDIARLD